MLSLINQTSDLSSPPHNSTLLNRTELLTCHCCCVLTNYPTVVLLCSTKTCVSDLSLIHKRLTHDPRGLYNSLSSRKKNQGIQAGKGCRRVDKAESLGLSKILQHPTIESMQPIFCHHWDSSSHG